VLLGEGDQWRAGQDLFAVAARATEARPADRFATVADMHAAWRAAAVP
jgi:hypothetical protein